MPSPRRRWLLLLVACAAAYPGWAIVATLIERPVEARQKENPAPGRESSKTPLFYGASTCGNAGCHGGSPPKKWAAGFPLLCRCDEFLRWEKHDKHADAYNVLLGKRGRRMEKLLGFVVTRDARCLNCHAVVINDREVEKESKAAGFTPTEGVSCVVCHGAYLEWVERHQNVLRAPKWRPLTRQQKEEQFGMRDLWDPVKRARLCASCHIGNAAEGKVVTHDMYAAGHPPLPGFEAAMFSDQMPRHWQYLREKNNPTLWKELEFKEKTREQTQLVLVGAAVVLGESLRLLEAEATVSLKANDALDLANFDCYACHHDIHLPSWRQKRGYPGRAGRVPMRTWPTELVRLGILHLAADETGAKTDLGKFDAQVAALQKAFTSRPLGDARLIRDESARFAKWADALAVRLKKPPVDEAGARRLLRLLPATYERETLDFDSARQVVWGYEIIYRELRGKPTSDLADSTDKDLPAPLVELRDYLKLRLPQGRMGESKVSAIEKELGDNLKQLYDYRPERFGALFGKLPGTTGGR